MKVTGNTIRDLVKSWELRKVTLETLFQDALFKFDDETKRSPLEISEEILQAEQKIVQLQVAQAAFNASTYVESRLLGRRLSLTEVVKLVGAYERLAKLWGATVQKKVKASRYLDSSTSAPVRNTTQVVAKEAIDIKGRSEMIEKYSKLLGHLKGLVSEGNNMVVPSTILDPSLYE